MSKLSQQDIAEIAAHEARAIRKGYIPAIRLNGTTDFAVASKTRHDRIYPVHLLGSYPK